MRLIDEQYTRTPFFGSRRMTAWLRGEGYDVNRKRVSRLMEVMGLEAIYPKPKLSQPGEGHKIYPYLLGKRRGQSRQPGLEHGHHVHPDGAGFVYLVAVMDWYSRFVLSWALSVTMEVEFCLEALRKALRCGRPEIFNSDQGSQFTSEKFTGELKTRHRDQHGSVKTIRSGDVQRSTNSTPKMSFSTIRARVSTVAATRSIASQATSRRLIPTLGIS